MLFKNFGEKVIDFDLDGIIVNSNVMNGKQVIQNGHPNLVYV